MAGLTIRILIADDHVIVRKGISFMPEVIDGQPCVGIKLKSSLDAKESLEAYLSRHNKTLADWIGEKVRGKGDNMKGKITGVLDPLTEAKREQLLAVSSNEENKAIIKKAKVGELVVVVDEKYQYCISSLQPSPGFWSYPSAAKFTRISTPKRRDILDKVRAELDEYLGLPIGSSTAPGLFLHPAYNTGVRFGDGTALKYDGRHIIEDLKAHGVYKAGKKRVTMGVLRIVPGNELNLVSYIQAQLNALGFSATVGKTIDVQDSSRNVIDSAVQTFLKERVDIIVAILPDEEDEDENDEGASSYWDLRVEAIKHGLVSQGICAKNLAKPFVFPNVVLGILAKTGTIPYILASAVFDVDLLVGLDVSRRKKDKLLGTVNNAASARIYSSYGTLIKYRLSDAVIQGETIPNHVLEDFFASTEFAGKRVIVHRDGPFRGQEREFLKDWAKKIGAKFILIEVLKTGQARIYSRVHGAIDRPEKGTMFRVGPTEAIVVSSLPPFKDATPDPLRVVVENEAILLSAVRSILEMTLLHFGSQIPPKCPVTIHFSDKIADMVSHGIKPKDPESNIPWWL